MKQQRNELIATPRVARALMSPLPPLANEERQTPRVIMDPDDLYRLSRLRELLAAQGVRLKQSLGQHFLHDRNVIEKIVRAAGVRSTDVVLEIGAGIGHLTLALAHATAHVIAVETDARLLPLLRDVTARYPHVRIVQADILAQPLMALCQQHHVQPNVIVANLPYYITTPVIEEMVVSELPLRSATFTVQTEAAQRLTAQPGQRGYGAAAVLLQLWGTLRCTGTIAPACFFPRPAVCSTVLHVAAHRPGLVPAGLWPSLVIITHAAFNQRRKTLANALGRMCDRQDELSAWFARAQVASAARAEQTPPCAFLRLAVARAAARGARASPHE